MNGRLDSYGLALVKYYISLRVINNRDFFYKKTN